MTAHFRQKQGQGGDYRQDHGPAEPGCLQRFFLTLRLRRNGG